MLTFDYCLKANPAFLSLVKVMANECIDDMKTVEEMNLVPQIFVLERDLVPLTPIYVSLPCDAIVIKSADIWEVRSSYSFIDIHNMLGPAIKKPAPTLDVVAERHCAKLEPYQADSGYWRVKVDGKLDPRLVGFEHQVDANNKALELYPDGALHFMVVPSAVL